MVSTFSPNRDYELPGTGDYTDTWGGVVNDNFTMIDSNISATLAVSLSSSNVTLSSTQAENMAYALTGTLSANVSLIFPAKGMFAIISNLTTGAFTVTAITSAGGSTGVALPQGGRSLVFSDGTNVYFADDATAVPIGSGMDFWGTTAPARWIFPYGQAVSRTTYSRLFAVMGTTYGSGDGSTTFNLPDKRDRASFGKGNMGGTSANRITNQAGGWNGNLLGGAGGQEQVILDVTQIPAHQHSGLTASENQTHVHAVASSPTYGSFAAGTSPAVVGFGISATGTQSNTHDHNFNTNFIGGGGGHNNLPPGIVCNYIIYAGV